MHGVLCASVAVAAMIGQLLFWRGGVVEFEATAFIPQYTADRPLLAKLFDPHLNDFDAYQARELSYLFDYGDAMCHAFLLRTFGVPFFISLSSMIATMLFAIVMTVGVRRTMPHLGAVTSAAVLAVFLSSFEYASSAGIYYRSSKMMLAVTIFALLFHLRRVALERHRRDPLVIALLCVVAGLLDRQGFFYVIVVAVVLGWHVLRTRALGDVWRAVAIAVVVLMAYNLVIAPVVIHALNGYWPDFEYQTRSLRSVALLWQPRYFLRAINLLAENLVVLAGDSIVPALASAVLLWLSRRRVSSAMRSRSMQYTAAAVVAQVLMFGAMIHQHPPIDEYVDHRLWYYALPFAATAMFALLMWLDALAPRLTRAQRAVTALVLAVMVIANVMGLDRHRQVMARGPYFARVFAQSSLLKTSIQSGTPDPQLDDAYREFFADEQRLRRR